MTAFDASVTITACGQSDVGLVRTNNEDNWLIADPATRCNGSGTASLSPAANLLLVADGMGGVQAGEVASRMAVDCVAEDFFRRLEQERPASGEAFARLIEASVQQANRVVFEQAQREERLNGMGTTLTAAAVRHDTIFFGQLGDSRAYLARQRSIIQMTQDQSLVAQLIAAGSLTPEGAKAHPQRNVILQALGIQPQVEVIISAAPLRRGDRLVMCSDGLSGKLEAEEIKEVLERWAEPQSACRRLVELARQRGGEDNITVVVACFDGDGLPLPEPDDIPVYTRYQEEARRRLWPWTKIMTRPLWR